jgi:hypothetical protein
MTYVGRVTLYSPVLYSLIVGFSEHVRFVQRLPDLSWPGCFDFTVSPQKWQTHEIEGFFFYEFYTLAFWHLHNTWLHTHNTARKTHALHKPSDYWTKNSHVGVNLTVTLNWKSLYFVIYDLWGFFFFKCWCIIPFKLNLYWILTHQNSK